MKKQSIRESLEGLAGVLGVFSLLGAAYVLLWICLD